ncbi:glutamine-fructose-6-phosphate transaminase [Bodo saltans virus]|uniref:glutamine--fructose-6-phosphate transaminase (isomerizing) n=1 Tax=Bodo saltans virus TaxID=2024608 RepID=A0A2H4UVK4_9VIRU|nr:glutamine-fructose-6-phosphate transaminase [Bodo saltans virus]ATZ80953.1 glutamine-fructose-6-phosphate transaminase [Bodo saltans virus]
MCGIFAYIGFDNSFLHGYNGIQKLLNRGYDSVGVTTINNNDTFITHKYASDDNNLANNKILMHQHEHNGSISIFHSRWRTVGDKSDINSHPHNDTKNLFSLVHNGIIENYISLREFLITNGYIFLSDTDTEVIVNLISYYYCADNININNETKVINAIYTALSYIKGTYGLCILCIDTPNNIYCIRNGSPILIGLSNNKDVAMISSEKYAFSKEITEYFPIDNNDLIVLKKEMYTIDYFVYSNKNYDKYKCTSDIESHTSSPYAHWTIKEINDQIVSCSNVIEKKIYDNDIINLDDLNNHKNLILNNCENLIMLGCGTSHHAGLSVLHIFKQIKRFNTIQVYDGSEFSINDIPKNGKTCVIFISQSGETKDLHRCLELCNSYNIITIGVINVVDSLIAREVTCKVYLECGREFAVASTKAFSSQIIVLTMIAIWFYQNIIGEYVYINSMINKIKNLSEHINNVINDNTQKCMNIATYLQKKNHVFLLGKESMEFIAKEGALKLKEIGYIHAEGYNSSALKHGTYALLETDFPVILLTPNDLNFNRNQGIFDELKARGAYVIGISNIHLDDKYDDKIYIQNDSYLEITICVVLQLIAYYLSIKKGINPDFPKNLSKTISVD